MNKILDDKMPQMLRGGEKEDAHDYFVVDGNISTLKTTVILELKRFFGNKFGKPPVVLEG